LTAAEKRALREVRNAIEDRIDRHEKLARLLLESLAQDMANCVGGSRNQHAKKAKAESDTAAVLKKILSRM